LSSFISTVGIAAGYSAGVVMICGMIAYFALFGSDGMALQVCIAACGAWWGAWSVFPLLALKYRPGPALPAGTSYLSFSWKKLSKTLSKARRRPNTFAFLLGYFFFSDGYNTMGSAAILIAKQSLDVGLTELTVCALIAPICALVGTFACFFAQKMLKASNKAMLLGILCVLGAIPLYCAVGLIPASPVGLRQPWEIYAITAVYGFFIGAVQSFARCLFADLIPAGEEAEFFSLYAVTDKGSAFLGPMVVAGLADWTGETRWGLVFLAMLILVPIPFIYRCVGKKSKDETHTANTETETKAHAETETEAQGSILNGL
jgi:UMF1 family MFS transporter